MKQLQSWFLNRLTNIIFNEVQQYVPSQQQFDTRWINTLSPLINVWRTARTLSMNPGPFSMWCSQLHIRWHRISSSIEQQRLNAIHKHRRHSETVKRWARSMPRVAWNGVSHLHETVLWQSTMYHANQSEGIRSEREVKNSSRQTNINVDLDRQHLKWLSENLREWDDYRYLEKISRTISNESPVYSDDNKHWQMRALPIKTLYSTIRIPTAFVLNSSSRERTSKKLQKGTLVIEV